LPNDIKNIPERQVLIDDDESGEDGEESTLDSDLFKSPTAKHFRPTIFVKKSPQLTYHAKLSMPL
jgi:hypothetical protein